MINVLIVDDTKSVHSFVTSLFSKSSEITTTSVYDGVQALETLKGHLKFDLILLDWEMPNLNGPSTLLKLKEQCIAVPVLMMTTKNDPSDISRAFEYGASEYLMKPFTIDILFEKIARVLNHEVLYVA